MLASDPCSYPGPPTCDVERHIFSKPLPGPGHLHGLTSCEPGPHSNIAWHLVVTQQPLRVAPQTPTLAEKLSHVVQLPGYEIRVPLETQCHARCGMLIAVEHPQGNPSFASAAYNSEWSVRAQFFDAPTDECLRLLQVLQLWIFRKGRSA